MPALVQIETYISFSQASFHAVRFAREFQADIVVRRDRYVWILLVPTEIQDDVKAVQREMGREAYYEEWEEEDRMLAHDETSRASAELVGELWGNADQRQESEEAGWLYSDEEDQL